MANIKSQKKRIRQDAKKNLRNKSVKTELKSSLKSLYDENNKIIQENKATVMKELDKAFDDAADAYVPIAQKISKVGDLSGYFS